MAVDSPAVLASRIPRAEAVARDLEAEILGGTLAPGERIGFDESKAALIEAFGP